MDNNLKDIIEDFGRKAIREQRALLEDPIKEIKLGAIRAQQITIIENCRKFPDLFVKQENKLFHYTDLNGLIGILSNKGFWLSDARYLNDAEELYNGASLSISLISSALQKNRFNQFNLILQNTLENLKLEKYPGHYICSFSLIGDSLEQWRAYANNENGVCIEFDLSKKTKFPHFNCQPRYHTQKVIYNDDIKKRILWSTIIRYKNEYLHDLKKFQPCDITEAYIHFLTFSLSSVFVNFKNNAFSNEQEVRIIDSSKKLDFYSQKRYRVSGGMIVPYFCTYESKLTEHDNIMRPDNLPIKKIIVGPVNHQKSKMDSITNFISDCGFDEPIQIIQSNVPYRG